jgi:hypothetical protein
MMPVAGKAHIKFYKIPMYSLFCRRPHEVCTFISGNFRSECSQVYNYHRLLTWDDVKGLHMDIFKVRRTELNTKTIRTKNNLILCVLLQLQLPTETNCTFIQVQWQLKALGGVEVERHVFIISTLYSDHGKISDIWGWGRSKCFVFSLLPWMRFLYPNWDFSTLTEVFPCLFLSYKAYVRVKPSKMGHGPHSSKFFVLFYVLFVLCRSVYCLFCVVLCPVCVQMRTVLFVCKCVLYCLCVNVYCTVCV